MSRTVEGFHHAAATPQERRDKRTGLMLVCDEITPDGTVCGQRIVPSGLGVGAHRRKHARERQASAWPAGKKFGELTPDQKSAAVRRATTALAAELTANADAIGRVLDDFDNAEGET